LLHCLEGKEARHAIVKQAKAVGLETKFPYETNEHAVEIVSSYSQFATHYDFLQSFANNSKVGVFPDHDFTNAGLNRFQRHSRRAPVTTELNERASAAAATVNYGQTATYMSQYYHFPAQQNPVKPPTIGIISLGGTYLTSDLTYYWQTVLKLSKLPTVSYVAVDKVTNKPNQVIRTNDGSDENTLDIEIAGGICPGAHIVVYFAPNTEKGFYDAFAYAINDVINKPEILSCSWGAPELDFTAAPNLLAYDQLFATAKQVICVAAGDNGSNDGVNDNKVQTDFPSSSGHVVTCGGTSLSTPGQETAWSWNRTYEWGTGGGISSYFPQPSFQTPVVTYPSGVPHMRATPDIALSADPLSGWTIYFNNKLYINQFGGTSCVAPAMAGLLGLMNLSYSGSAALNQKMYTAYTKPATKAAFKDITVGSNDNISTANRYTCGVGYDCCTGLGSLNGTLLLAAL
jgi:kumamolisin